MKALNPFQMRRAVRDYRYEVGEGRMNDECLQYLAQLQKDWRLSVHAQEARRHDRHSACLDEDRDGYNNKRASLRQMSQYLRLRQLHFARSAIALGRLIESHISPMFLYVASRFFSDLAFADLAAVHWSSLAIPEPPSLKLIIVLS